MGLSLPMIGKLLGHTQAATTQRYAHLADDPSALAASSVANHIEKLMMDEPGDQEVIMWIKERLSESQAYYQKLIEMTWLGERWESLERWDLPEGSKTMKKVRPPIIECGNLPHIEPINNNLDTIEATS